MKRRKDAEAEVLDRLIHLLEEGSVTRLTGEDYRFGKFIDGLSVIIRNQAERLTIT
jgi:hypothetical protein